MVELLRYLEANDFSTYIASAGIVTSCGRSLIASRDPARARLVLLADADREFAYATAPNDALERAKTPPARTGRVVRGLRPRLRPKT